MQTNKMQTEERPERVAWYRDLVEDLTGWVPMVRTTTVPVLIEGKYWQVPWVTASVPAFLAVGGFSLGAIREGAATEAEALRALCESVHGTVWNALRARDEEPGEYLLVVG